MPILELLVINNLERICQILKDADVIIGKMFGTVWKKEVTFEYAMLLLLREIIAMTCKI